MSVLYEIPLSSGGSVVVEAQAAELPAALMLPVVEAGGPAARSSRDWGSLTSDLADILQGLQQSLVSSDRNFEVSAEFGIRFGGTSGILLVPPSGALIKLSVKLGALAEQVTPD